MVRPSRARKPSKLLTTLFTWIIVSPSFHCPHPGGELFAGDPKIEQLGGHSVKMAQQTVPPRLVHPRVGARRRALPGTEQT